MKEKEKKRKIDISSLEYIPREHFEFKDFYRYIFSLDDSEEKEEFYSLFENAHELLASYDEDHVIAVFVADDYMHIMTVDYISSLGHQIHFWRANIL